MRLLYLCTDAYGGHGGIALFNRQFIEALSCHEDVEEIVVLPRLIVRSLEPIPVKVRFVAHASRGRAAYLRELLTMRRQGGFDLVFCGHVNLLPLSRLVTRHPVLVIYGIDAWRPLRDPLSNRLLRTLGGVVVISELTLDRFLGWSGTTCPAHLLPPAIHVERYGIRPKSPDLITRWHLEGRRVLLTLGRIVAAERYKGFDEVLDVLPQVAEVYPSVTYVAAGDGSDLSRLARKAAALGVADRVVFTGMVREEEKADLYNLADVYVMPSRGEGFGLVLLEAMASGVPVIGSRLDGGREALLGGMLGRLIDPTNPAEIRVALLDALAEGERKVPEGLDYFSFARFVERTHAIVERMRTGTGKGTGTG